MKNLKRLSEIARAVALSGNGTGGRNGRSFRLGAILFDKKGRVVRSATNSYKSHPRLLNYSSYPFLHAESACVLKQGLDNCDSLSLMVVRVLRDGTFADAKPCASCQKLLLDTGVNKVYYSDNKGIIV